MAGMDFAQILRRLKPGGDRVERHIPDIRNDMHFAFLSLYRLAAHFSAGRRVLDAGCGTGYGDLSLCGQGAASVLGIDINPKAVSYARRHFAHPNLRFESADGTRLPFGDHTAEVVFSSNVIEHVADYSRYLDEIQRVLTPDGVLILITPVVEISGESDSPYHITNLCPEEWDKHLRQRFGQVVFLGHYLDAYPQHLIPWNLSPLVQRLMVHPIYKSLPEAVRQRILQEMAWNPFGLWEGDFEFRPCQPTVEAMGTSMSLVALCSMSASALPADFTLARQEKVWSEEECHWFEFWRDLRRSFASYCGLFPVLDDKGERLRDEVWVAMPETRGLQRPGAILSVPEQGLAGVRVMFATFARQNAGQVFATVCDQEGFVLREVSAPSSELVDGAFHDFVFEPIKPEHASTVQVAIRTEGTRPGNAPTVWTKYDCLKFEPGVSFPKGPDTWGGPIIEAIPAGEAPPS